MNEDRGSRPHFDISWIDDDTLRYAEDGRHVLIGIDVNPGLLSGGVVVHADSIDHWINAADGSTSPVTDVDREVILFRLEGYDPLRKRRFQIARDADDPDSER
ncbi:MAG: hypothetical protein KJO82_07045 [Gammaproteobacteria bacterium]|nr:hypothetical protein [Gammaproteobacteria bacterium]